jgi:hypothetical protein
MYKNYLAMKYSNPKSKASHLMIGFLNKVACMKAKVRSISI